MLTTVSEMGGEGGQKRDTYRKADRCGWRAPGCTPLLSCASQVVGRGSVIVSSLIKGESLRGGGGGGICRLTDKHANALHSVVRSSSLLSI
jgi:hypothetical protein